MGLQRTYVLRNSRLRDMQLIGGARKAARPAHGQEALHAIIEHAAPLITDCDVYISVMWLFIMTHALYDVTIATQYEEIDMTALERIKDNGAGIALCLAIALPAWLLGRQFDIIGGPVFAILIGMAAAAMLRSRNTSAFASGIAYTSKKVLQYAVILLGFGLNLAQIAQVGATSLPIIISTITTSLVIAFVLSRALKIPAKISTLVGVGSSICGGSAIAATAPVIDADDEEIAQAISVIFLFNIVAALIFPALGGMLGLTNEGFGLFAGTAVNDTSSVTAAAAAWDGMHPGANTLDTATIVKLTRTLAIIPITLVLAFLQVRSARKAAAAGESTEGAGSFNLAKIFPVFILFFVLASVITTVFALPAEVTAPVKELSKFLIVMAMAAIGLNTDLVKLVRTGGKPILMGFCCWVGIAAVSLGMQHLLGIW